MQLRTMRSGFTVVELIVVIAIISVGLALLLAGVQRIRAAARMGCANNLHQIGVALHSYHDEYGHFPAGVSWNKGKHRYRLMSWHTRILPNLEQAPLWRKSVAAWKQSRSPFQNPPHEGLATVLPLFSCPADGRAASLQLAQRQKINVALTNYLGVTGRDLRTNDGILFRDSKVRLNDVRDGTSHTLLVGERPPSPDNQFGWWYAGTGQFFTGSCDMILGVEEINILPRGISPCLPGRYRFVPGSESNQCDMYHYWSHHSGGAHFLFADGSVRFLSYSAASILPALASRVGGETEADF